MSEFQCAVTYPPTLMPEPPSTSMDQIIMKLIQARQVFEGVVLKKNIGSEIWFELGVGSSRGLAVVNIY